MISREDATEIQRRIAALESRYYDLTGRDSEDDEDVRTSDVPWTCTKCKRHLGWYDRTTDILRMKHRGLVMRIKLGGGRGIDAVQGYIELTCWGCAEVLSVQYEAALTPLPGPSAR